MPDQDLIVRVTVPPAVNVRVTAGGPKGADGAQGPPGVDGGSAFYFEFVQVAPAMSWTVHHALNHYPNVSVILTDGTVGAYPDVDHLSVDELVIAFEEPTSGRAICS